MTHKKMSLSPLSPNALERWRQKFMWRLRLLFSSYKKSRGPQSPRHRRSTGAFTCKTHVFYAMTFFPAPPRSCHLDAVLICELVQVGRSRKVDMWNNVSKQRYVTIRDILVPFVTSRYDAVRNRCSLGVFPWHMQKGLLQPLSPNATRTERWCYIFYVTTWSRI